MGTDEIRDNLITMIAANMNESGRPHSEPSKNGPENGAEHQGLARWIFTMKLSTVSLTNIWRHYQVESRRLDPLVIYWELQDGDEVNMVTCIITAIDKEIASLQQARAILSGSTDLLPGISKGKRGRPKGSKNVAAATPAKPKRVMTEEGRARILAAMKKRHAAKKRAAKKAAAEGETEQDL